MPNFLVKFTYVAYKVIKADSEEHAEDRLYSDVEPPALSDFESEGMEVIGETKEEPTK